MSFLPAGSVIRLAEEGRSSDLSFLCVNMSLMGCHSTQSTLYLLTFLITLVVLALISAALLLRAYYVRRRFQRRIQEAIANGQALPPDALAGLGIARRRRGKPEKKHGPMPTMWEAEMYHDEVDEEGSKRASEMRADRYDRTEKVYGSDEEIWRDLTVRSSGLIPGKDQRAYTDGVAAWDGSFS